MQRRLLYSCDFYLKYVRKRTVEKDILKIIFTLALVAEYTRRTFAHIILLVGRTGPTVGTRRVDAGIWR